MPGRFTLVLFKDAVKRSFNARAQAVAVAARARNVEARLRSLDGHWDSVPPQIVREAKAALVSLCRRAARAPWK